MVLRALISDMTQLETELSRFEKRFGVKSSDFYLEFVEWLALYKSWMSLDEKYRQLIFRQSVAVQIKSAMLA
jgi:hypothetical protein